MNFNPDANSKSFRTRNLRMSQLRAHEYNLTKMLMAGIVAVYLLEKVV